MTRLPNVEQARIDPRKLREYVLNIGHVTGRYKAAFFAQMGYSADQWRLLDRDIREQHLNQDAEMTQLTRYGQKYTVTAPLHGPNGERRWVKTVWIVRTGNDFAELITVEPARRR